MPTKRAPRASAKPHAEKRSVTRTTGLVLLVVGLALSAYNLALMTSKSGTLAGISESWYTLQENYASSAMGEEPVFEEVEPETPTPAVLASVVRWREGEEDAVRANLLAPLLSWYSTQADRPLTAVLIERKNAGSRDVNVRLFFQDGAEEAFLWPSTRSQDGVWTSPMDLGSDVGFVEDASLIEYAE